MPKQHLKVNGLKLWQTHVVRVPFSGKSIKLQPNDSTTVSDTEVDWWHSAITAESREKTWKVPFIVYTLPSG